MTSLNSIKNHIFREMERERSVIKKLEAKRECLACFSFAELSKDKEAVLTKLRESFRDRRGWVVYYVEVKGNFGSTKLHRAYNDIKDKISDRLSFARVNSIESSNSDILYVGSSKDFIKRIKEHLGMGAKKTYALRMCEWCQELRGEIFIHYFQFDSTVDHQIILKIEDQLSILKSPLFGRRGAL